MRNRPTLAELNAGEGFEGRHVYSIWSRDDQIVGYGGLVYGRQTSRIPGQEGEAVFNGYPYGHFCVRDLTAPVQLQMIHDHRAPWAAGAAIHQTPHPGGVPS